MKAGARVAGRGAAQAGLLGCAAAVCLWALGCAKDPGPVDWGASPSPDDPPTVVLVTIDTLRADRLGCYGKSDAGTPTLDRLAEAGVLFTKAHTTAPMTLPSHASMLTGRSVPAHGVKMNGTFALPGGIPTLAERLKAKGFATGAFVSSQVLARRYGLARGFDSFSDNIRQRGPAAGGFVLGHAERSGMETVSVATAWLMDRPGQAAFVWAHIWEPHAPYSPPRSFAERFPDDLYQGEVAAADAAVGRLLTDLRGLDRSRLLVVVVGDHGEALDEHGEQTHGIYLYQGVMRVPLIIYGPSFGVRPGIVQAPVSVADLAPTLIELLDADSLGQIDAASLAAGLTGSGAYPADRGVFAESHQPQIEHGWSGLRALIHGRYKLVEAPRLELYDLEADPEESTNLAEQLPDETARAKQALDRLVSRAKSLAAGEGAEQAASDEQLEMLRSLGYVSTARRVDSEQPLVDPGAVDPKDRQQFVARFDRAVGQAQSGALGPALEELTALAALEPRSPAFLLQYGQSLIMAGRHEEAIGIFERAVDVDPEFGLAWYRLGQLFDSRQSADQAEACYRRAAEIDPLAVEVRLALASLLLDQGELDEASLLLDQVQQLAPDDEMVQRESRRLRQSIGAS
ncbi:MAG: sulfatase-like hydrolase/transferase [Acidobacteriota bacterium]|nr:MAG: sulfatase-like hydrolase/transferase [Acidobacteriota bacterium]